MCVFAASWSSQVNRTTEGIACRLSKLPPVSPVSELLTLSTVRLAVAIIQTWPGLWGSLARGRTPLCPDFQMHWRKPVYMSELKGANPCTTSHARDPLSIMSTLSNDGILFWIFFPFIICLLTSGDLSDSGLESFLLFNVMSL